MPQLPRITLVTPSYNQGQYLAETIQSVVGQCYPNLEYFVMDGGSTDNSVEVIKAYEKYIDYWVSEKDNGQSHAINKGFARATGEILCWLNSDDMLLPGALHFVADFFAQNPDVDIVTGNCIHVNYAENTIIGSDVEKSTQTLDLELFDTIIQPSTFWRKSVVDKVGILREDMHYAFDWEWFLRAKKMGSRFFVTNRYLSVYRLHHSHKTGTGGDKRQKEILRIAALYNPPEVIELINTIIANKTKIFWVYNWLLRLKLYNNEKVLKQTLSSRFKFLKVLPWDITKQCLNFINLTIPTQLKTRL